MHKIFTSIGNEKPQIKALINRYFRRSGHAAAGILERAGARLAVTDLRNPGREIDVTFSAELDLAQGVAVSALLAHDDGVLVPRPDRGRRL